MTPEAYLYFAYRTAVAAGAVTLPHFRVPIAVDDKGESTYDPVTAADLDAEAVIRAAIAKAFPDHGIRGEEHGFERGRSRYTWVIDPVDGTRSFITGQLQSERGVGGDLQRAPGDGLGVGRPSKAAEDASQVRTRQRIAGLQPPRLRQRVGSRGEVPVPLQGESQAQVGLGEVGTQPDRFAIGLRGLVEAILLEEDRAELGVGAGDRRGVTDSRPEQRLGFGGSAQPAQDHCQLDRHSRVVGSAP